MRDDLDQTLGFELQQGLAQRNTTDPEFGRERVLPELETCREAAGENAASQLLGCCGGQRPMRQSLGYSGSDGRVHWTSMVISDSPILT